MINRISNSKYTKKILIISPNLPYPLDDGIKIRLFHTINELKGLGHQITLMCFTGEKDEINIKKLKMELDINVVGIYKKDRYFSILRVLHSLFSKYPFYIEYFYKSSFKKKLKKLIHSSDFKLLYVYDRSMVLYGKDVELPKMLDSVDSQSLNSFMGFKSTKNIIHKMYWYSDYIKSKKLEKSIYPLYNHVITISERDAEQLRNITKLKVVNTPSGVDLSYFKPINMEKIPYSLAFLGTMDAFSNQQAVLYFIKEIFPSIKQNFPSVKLLIIGRNPPREILKLHDGSNVFVMGYVEDIRTCINKSEIIISPLKMASGLQTKILVSMAMNKPIVSTKESIGEINKVINNNDIVIVDNSEEFITGILDLFSDKNLLSKIGKNGRDIVKKNYSWKSLGCKVDKLIKTIID